MLKPWLRKTLTVIAFLVTLFFTVNHFSDWQVLLTKTGVKFLDTPSADDPVLMLSAKKSSSDNDQQAQHAASDNFALDVVVDGLELPWSMTLLDDDTALVTERAGKLYSVSLSSGEKTEISGIPKVYYKGQAGLFDVLPHPDYPQQPWLYISYAIDSGNNNSTTRLARAKYDKEQQKLNHWQLLYTAAPALETKRHYGGRLFFHKQHLYLTMGERGHREYAQKLDNDLGKVLRFDLEGKPAEDNPFINTAKAKPAIFSYGHRNQQGLVQRPNTDELWISEHGPQGGDEINLLIAGANYGWPIITYGEEYGGGVIGKFSKEGMQQPLHYYIPSIATGNLAFYSGEAFPGWNNSIFVTGLRSLNLSRLTLDNIDGQLKVIDDQRLLQSLQFRLRDIKISDKGLIYLLSENGSIALLRPE